MYGYGNYSHSYIKKDKRPPFQVSNRSCGIPEPPNIYRCHPLLTGPPKLQMGTRTVPWWKDTQDFRKLHKLRAEYRSLEAEFTPLLNEVAVAGHEVKTQELNIKVMQEDTKDKRHKIRMMRRQLHPMERFRRSVKDKQRDIETFVEEKTFNTPQKIREENREMRKTLLQMESQFQKKKEEHRQLNVKQGTGPSLKAFSNLKTDHDEVDDKLDTFRRKRDDLRYAVFKITNELNTTVGGLAKTNQKAFKQVDLTLYRVNELSGSEEDIKNGNKSEYLIPQKKKLISDKPRVLTSEKLENHLDKLPRNVPTVRVRPLTSRKVGFRPAPPNNTKFRLSKHNPRRPPTAKGSKRPKTNRMIPILNGDMLDRSRMLAARGDNWAPPKSRCIDEARARSQSNGKKGTIKSKKVKKPLKLPVHPTYNSVIQNSSNQGSVQFDKDQELTYSSILLDTVPPKMSGDTARKTKLI